MHKYDRKVRRFGEVAWFWNLCTTYNNNTKEYLAKFIIIATSRVHYIKVSLVLHMFSGIESDIISLWREEMGEGVSACRPNLTPFRYQKSAKSQIKSSNEFSIYFFQEMRLISMLQYLYTKAFICVKNVGLHLTLIQGRGNNNSKTDSRYSTSYCLFLFRRVRVKIWYFLYDLWYSSN